MSETQNDQCWWGTFKFSMDQMITWEFEEFAVSIARHKQEWNTFHQYQDSESEVFAGTFKIKYDGELITEKNYERYVYSSTAESLSIKPALPDRNIVTKPFRPIALMPEQEVVLYVGASLWFVARQGDQDVALMERPLRVLSDTWFGPSPRIGELCYASKTRAYIDPAAIPAKQTRAIVPVRIRNESETPMKIEKLSVPVPMLDLYTDKNMNFWATPVFLRKEGAGSHVSLSLDKLRRYPAFSSGLSTLVSQSRKPSHGNLIFKAYDMLFS